MTEETRLMQIKTKIEIIEENTPEVFYYLQSPSKDWILLFKHTSSLGII